MKRRDRTCGYHNPELEVMVPARKADYQLDLVRRAAVRACGLSTATRMKFAEGGVDPAAMASLDDLSRLPLTRKRDFPAIQAADLPFGGFNTVLPSALGHIFVSPGPIYDPEGREEDFWNLRGAFYAGGFRKGDIVQNTFAYHLTPAGLMCDQALRDLGCAVIPAGVGNTDIQVTAMRDLKVTGYVGTPSFLLTILTRAREMGLDPGTDLALEVAYLAGEILAPSLRKSLEEEHGLHVRQGYITADLGVVGYECGEKSGYHIPEAIVVEILHPATGEAVAAGEPGEVVVTACRESYPLFRFATGDLSSLVQGRCACGRTSPRLTGILGRADEVTKVRGMFIHPGMIDQILARGGGYRGQAVVTRKGHQDHLVLRVVPREGGDLAADLALMREAGRQVLKLRLEVEETTAEALGPRPKKIDDQRVWE